MKLTQNIKAKWQQSRTKHKQAVHRSFKMTPRTKRQQLAGGVKEAWRLIIETILLLKNHKKIFVWLIILYAFLTYTLVGGISQADYTALKDSATDYVGGLDLVTTAVAYFGAALTGGLVEISNELQQFLSGVITLLFWLVTIWAARMLLAGQAIKLRDAFYSGPTPFISTLVMLLIVALQLVPAAVGLFAFTIGMTEGWINNVAVGMAFGAAAALLVLVSLYLLSGSVIGVAIVALPGMYPLRALADARTLVMGRRWNIMMRIVSVLIVQLLLWALILIPIFILDYWLRLEWLPLVPIMVQAMAGFSLIFTSVYVYKLYRSLLYEEVQ